MDVNIEDLFADDSEDLDVKEIDNLILGNAEGMNLLFTVSRHNAEGINLTFYGVTSPRS